MLTNPYGLLALLGIPAVLAIHFLQRKAVQLPVSTLFLLERTQREAASGRRLDRLIPSIPLWMQLLAIVFLTWFLVEPRYPNTGSVQRVAIVLDSSASMSVFKADAIQRLTSFLPQLKGAASALEITVLESSPNRPRLYAGNSVDDLKGVLEKWQPRDGLIDPAFALRLARSLVSSEGFVLYLTDTPVETLPFDAKLLSVGRVIENTGFTGITFSTEEGTVVWKALVRNYGTSRSERTWSMISSEGSTEPRPIVIEPGGLLNIQAAFPTNAKNVRLVLSADPFPLDDILPLVAPQPKPLNLFTPTSSNLTDLVTRLTASLPGALPTNDAATADLTIAGYDPLDPILPSGNSVVFVEDPTSAGSYLRGGIIAEPDPLLDGLNWQSLLVRETIQLDRLPSDRVLLWQEKRPLIFLRQIAGTSDRKPATQLCFNFDLNLSNAANQPAFIVLLHRFAETIREGKVAATAENLETNQPFHLTTHPGKPLWSQTLDPSGKVFASDTMPSATDLRAPVDPGFLTIAQDQQTLLTAALHFADTREADFTHCAPAEHAMIKASATQRLHTEPDPLWQLWLILLLVALLISWKFTANSRRASNVAIG